MSGDVVITAIYDNLGALYYLGTDVTDSIRLRSMQFARLAERIDQTVGLEEYIKAVTYHALAQELMSIADKFDVSAIEFKTTQPPKW